MRSGGSGHGAGDGPGTGQRSTPGQRRAWCLYDFGNSAYPTVITTALFVVFFRGVIVGGEDKGHQDLLWGLANSSAALCVFLLAPTLGRIADRGASRRRFLRLFAVSCAASTALLATTGPGSLTWAFLLVVLSAFAFEGGNVFYNSFLPVLAEPDRMQSLSGRAWALGYVGGLLCLGACLPFVLDAGEASDNMPWVCVLVGAWYLVFTTPALRLLPEESRAEAEVAPKGPANPWTLLRSLGHEPVLGRFLWPYFLYMNALNAMIVFAAAFAEDNLGFVMFELILLVVVLNLVAAPGALLFARIAERLGTLRGIELSLGLWVVAIAGALVVAWPGLLDSAERASADRATARAVFWGVAIVASLAIGATQSLSRTYVAQIVPAGRSSEFYGFLAFSGRGSAVLGPLAFGLASKLAGGDQRLPVAVMGVFFVVGLVGIRALERRHRHDRVSA